LKYSGAAVVAGQFSGWTPIGAEQTATGYDVGWKAGADQYTVWSTDSSGNFVANITGGAVSGSNSALESLETTFHQDLNGDGVIGVPAMATSATGEAMAGANGTTSTATQSFAVTIGGPGNDSFVFHPGIGPDHVLNFGSADTIELDGFASIANKDQLTAFLSNAQAGQPQPLFEPANDHHDTVLNLGNHDSITLINVRIADLAASNFILH
jgi:hypothetical protein